MGDVTARELREILLLLLLMLERGKDEYGAQELLLMLLVLTALQEE